VTKTSTPSMSPNTSMKSAKMPTGPVTWAARPGVSLICPRSQTTSGTNFSTSDPANCRITWAALPSWEKIGPSGGATILAPKCAMAADMSAAMAVRSASVRPVSRP
jgi:hypothetical protein